MAAAVPAALSDDTGREPVTDTNRQLEVRGPPPSVTDRYYTKYYALGNNISLVTCMLISIICMRVLHLY